MSIHHATNTGLLFRPDNPLLPNYKHVPIAYHGRASPIVVSGTPVIRPRGQTRLPNEAGPTFGASQRLDYELELGVFNGSGNALGKPIALADAEDHVFGLCLVNDWSARDIQSWEYQPLGPFLGKSFATSISPWVVTRTLSGPERTACGSLLEMSVNASHSSALPSGETRTDYQLYLPEEWAADARRRRMAKIPEVVRFATKSQIALEQMCAAKQRGVPQGIVLADAGYGRDTALRDALDELGLSYAVGVISS